MARASGAREVSAAARGPGALRIALSSVPRASDPRLAEHAVGRALAHALLADAANCPPQAIELAHTPNGAPVVVGPGRARRLQVSLAHADGLVLCAVALDQAVGADLESLRSVGPDALRIARVAFPGREVARLRGLSPAGRARRVLARWTLVEALAKATRAGLPDEPRDMDLRWDARGVLWLRWRGPCAAKPSRWSSITFSPTRRHVASVVLGLPGSAPPAAEC